MTDYIDLTHPYDADEEVQILVRDVLQTYNELFVRDGAYLYVRCADGRMRPLDEYTAYKLDDLRWTADISVWRRNGRRGPLPRSAQNTFLSRARNLFARWRVMWGRDYWTMRDSMSLDATLWDNRERDAAVKGEVK